MATNCPSSHGKRHRSRRYCWDGIAPDVTHSKQEFVSMMKFTRPSKPGYLDNYKKWGREYANKKQQGMKPKWHKKIKQWEQLKTYLAKLTIDHCSFCESYPLVAKNIRSTRRTLYERLIYQEYKANLVREYRVIYETTFS